MKAINIKWDIDLENGETYEEVLKDCELPTEIEIPEGMSDEEDISDWLSDEYGFCHDGFDLVDRNDIKEQFIKFIDVDTDRCGNDITIIAKIVGNDITDKIIERVKCAIWDYQNENEGEWNVDGCLNAAKKQLELEHYEVYWINFDFEICI